jgi:hypothetical protein
MILVWRPGEEPADGARSLASLINATPGFTTGDDVVDASGRPEPTRFVIDANPGQIDSGRDTIVGFGRNDILVLDDPLLDGNRDGIVTFGANRVLDLDQPQSRDSIAFVNGPSSKHGVRYLGEDEDGQHLYADARTRPLKAVEGTLGDDALRGDAGDRKGQVFFFDTALEIDWGRDSISRFSEKDLLVVTSPLAAEDGVVALEPGEKLNLNGSALGPSFGQLDITDLAGQSVGALYLRGVEVHAGVTYSIYGLTPGAPADLVFIA